MASAVRYVCCVNGVYECVCVCVCVGGGGGGGGVQKFYRRAGLKDSDLLKYLSRNCLLVH